MSVTDLSLSQVRNFDIVGGTKRPRAIATRCGSCGDKVVVSVNLHGPNATNLRLISLVGACPSCKEANFFSAFYDSSPTDGVPNALIQYATETKYFEEPVFPEDMPAALQRAIKAAIASFNEKNYTATAVLGRRALEGMFKYLVPEEDKSKPLHALIEQVKTSPDFAAHLSKLSHVVREGGNLGAHFDEAREPNEEIARQLVELMSYLAAYLYTLPAKIENLEQSIKPPEDL
ncbi:DUF4145 domain-containing protein [Thioclava sp.]|uniref:DUF4145 domain-containing protein n=1 Tax=Thioclava sp. TaxID=1933450 RepID=UPI0032421438